MARSRQVTSRTGRAFSIGHAGRLRAMRLHRELYGRQTRGLVIVNRRVAVAQKTAPARGAGGLDFSDDRQRNLCGCFRTDVYADGTVKARELGGGESVTLRAKFFEQFRGALFRAEDAKIT